MMITGCVSARAVLMATGRR